MKIALQLYTLRDALAKDFEETLKAVAKAGYSGVEFAGFHKLSAGEISPLLKEYGLTALSAHMGYRELEGNIDLWCENARLFDMRKLTVPGVEHDILRTDIGRFTDVLNTVSERLADRGIELSFHNHSIEFSEGYIYKIMERCPDLKMELDTYWAKFAGTDPIEVMDKYRDRVSLIHIKDMLDKSNITEATANPNILEGCMDIKGILKKAGHIGLDWAIVEMDITVGDPVQAAVKSRKNLAGIGY